MSIKSETVTLPTFQYTSTDPVSRSASGVSIDAAKSKYSELLKQLEAKSSPKKSP